jgi:hypothetical protein
MESPKNKKRATMDGRPCGFAIPLSYRPTRYAPAPNFVPDDQLSNSFITES